MSAPPLATSKRQACPACQAVFRRRFVRCPLDGNVLEPIVELPLIGKVLAGRYAIEACIGEGGMGQVYRAKHTRLSRRFAIKLRKRLRQPPFVTADNQFSALFFLGLTKRNTTLAFRLE